MFLIELNRDTRENYAFFDPSAPIELNLVSPRGYAPRLTDSILRGLKAGTLIDVEGKIDIEKGAIKNGEEQGKEKREEETTTESSLQSKEIANEKKEELSLSEPSNEDVEKKTVKNRKKK